LFLGSVTLVPPRPLPPKKGVIADSGNVLQDDEVATSWLNNEAVRKALHAEDVR